jgi:cell division protease FtsH
VEENKGNNNEDDKGRKPGQDDKEEFSWNKNLRPIIFWAFIVIAMILLWESFPGKEQGDNREISYSRFRSLVEEKNVESGRILIQNKVYFFHGTLVKPINIVSGRAKTAKPVRKFYTVLPYVDKDLEKWLEKNQVAFTYVYEDDQWSNLLISILPWALILFVWIFMMRRMSGGNTGGKGIFSFGKSRHRVIDPNKNKVTFDDVAGADEAKEELQEVVEFLKAPEKFSSLGGKIPKGVLLVGPPGTGKTLLARAVAGEADVPFFSISGADFVEMFVGVGASRVRDLFEQGRKNKPCIIFIDELDAVGRQRGAGLGGGHDEREQTLNQLLVEMDGFEHSEGVILLAATNRPDVLDSALMRPGRFDRQVVVSKPDIRGRYGILKVHTRNIPLAEEVDLMVLAKSTPGTSGADLANIINEAALIAARHGHTEVQMSDIEQARDKVFMGPERRSLIMSERDKKVVAYHEAGHALVGKLLEHAEPIHKVTIIPRGLALGVTHTLPEADMYNYPKEYFLDELAVFMGGRVSESITFNSITTGASNDIERATMIARKMVMEWGMSERLGTLTFGTKQEEVFLGRELGQQRNYSERTAQMIDEEVAAIVKNAYHLAEKIIKENIEGLKALAEALLEKETVDAKELDEILRSAGVDIPEKAPEVQFVEKLLKKRAGRKSKTAENDISHEDEKSQTASGEENPPGKDEKAETDGSPED